MAFTYDLSTDRGKVRLIIQDSNATYPFYTDEEIDAFITIAGNMEGDSVFNAAAVALESWASNQVLILKVVTLLDVEVDGAKVAAEMRARAAVLRADAISNTSDAGFEIAEMALGEFSWREQVINEAIRDD
jgi:hypothetical protein